MSKKVRSKRALALIAAVSGLALFQSSPAHAATYTWDADKIPGNGIFGGSGAWITNGTASNWYNGATDINWTSTSSGDTAVFGGSAGNVTLTTVSAAGLVFNTTGYLLTSSNLTIGSGGITLNTAADTIGSVVTGSAGVGLALTGAGTLTLTGADTYTGTTSIGSGIVLNIQNATAMGTTTATVASGGQLQIQGGITAANSLSINGTGISTDGAIRSISGANALTGGISLASNSQIQVDAGSLTVASTSAATSIVGASTLTKTGAGTLLLNTSGTGSNTFTDILVKAGTVIGATGTSFRPFGSGNIILGDTIGNLNASVFNSALSSSLVTENVIVSANTTGTLTLGNDNGTQLTGGIVKGGYSGSISLGNNLQIATVGDSSLLTATGDQIPFSGNIVETGGSFGLTINAPNTEISLAGSNVYSGGTTITAGYAVASMNNGAVDNFAFGSGTITVGTVGNTNSVGLFAVLESTISNLIHVQNTGGIAYLGSTGGTNMAIFTNTITLDQNATLYSPNGSGGNTVLFKGPITGVGGLIAAPDLANASSTVAEFTLAGSDSYTGATVISNDVLLAVTNTSGVGSSAVVVEGGGRLFFATTLSNVIAQSVRLDSDAAAGMSIMQLPGTLSTGGVDASSTGLIALNGTGFTQANLINGSSAFLGSNLAGGSTFTGANLTVGSGATYRLGGGGGLLTLTKGVLTDNGGTASNLVVGSLLTNGGGTVSLTGNNTFTGAITIAGISNLTAVNTTTSSPSMLAGTAQTSGSPFGGGGNNVNITGGVLQLNSATSGATVALGTLTVEGTGQIATNNTGGNSVMHFANYTANNDAVLFVNGATGSGSSNLIYFDTNAPTVTNGMVASSFLYGSNFSGTVTADFATYVTAGNLGFQSASNSYTSTTAGNNTIATDGTAATKIYNITGSDTQSISTTVYALRLLSSDLVGASTVTVSSGGIITSNGAAHTISVGLALPNSESVFAATQGAGASPLVLSGVLSGGGASASFVKTGLQVLLLTNTNTYTGTLYLNQGRVEVVSDAALGNTANNIVLDGGLLTDTGATSSNVFASTRTLTVAAGGGQIGTFTDAGTNTWQGPVNGSGLLNVVSTGNSDANTRTMLFTGSFANFTGTFSVGSVGANGGGTMTGVLTPTGFNSAASVAVAGANPTAAIPNSILNTNIGAAASFAIDGTANVSNANLSLGNLQGGGTGALNVGLAATQNTLTIGSDNTNTEYFGAINALAGTLSLNKTGSGKLALWGASTYTGSTSISGGTLAVNGSIISNVSVASGATLGGSGLITGSVLVNTGGHLGPGNSPGTLYTTGNATVSIGGNLDYDLSSVTNTVGSNINDLWSITGNLNLATSGTLNIFSYGANSPSLVVNSTYDLINFTGALSTASTGTLSSWVLPTITGEALSLVATNGQIDLLVSGAAANASSLSLAPSTLTYNTHVGVTGPGVNATLSNITSTGDGGSFTLASIGSSLTVSPLTGSLTAGSSASINSAWGNVASAGARSSTLTVTNNSTVGPDGSNHTITITGGVYNYATATVNTPSVTLANVFTGSSAPTANIGLSNISPSNGFSESLDAGISSLSNAGMTSGGTVSLLAAGGSASNSLSVSSTTGTSHAGGGTAVLSLTSDGSGTSGLGLTSLASQTVMIVGGAVFDHASLTVGSPVNIRLTQGATGTQTYSLGNTAGTYRDTAAINSNTASSGLSTSGVPSSLAQGASSINTLSLTSGTTGSASDSVVFQYGDTQTSLSGANNNNQFATLTVNAQVDPIVEHVANTSGIDLTTRGVIGTASPAFIAAGQYFPGVLNNINSGSGASAGTVQIAVTPSGQTAGLQPESVLLFDFGSTYSTSGFSTLTSDLSLYGYNYSTNTTSGALGYFDHSPFQPTSYSYELSVTFTNPPSANPSDVDFNFSKYGLTVDNFAAVPEPTTIGLLGVAGLGLLARRRSRSKTAAGKR